MIAEGEYNDMAKLFKKITNIGFFFGLPNIWIEDVEYSKRTVQLSKAWRVVSNVIFCVFMAAEIAAFGTQKNLSEKQKSDRLIFSTSQPLLFSYIVVIELYVDDVKLLLRELVVVLKSLHNDEEVQRELIWKAKVYTCGFLSFFFMALLSYGLEATKLVVTGEGTFTTVVMCWPDVDDRSRMAHLTRLLAYLIWWVFMLRVAAVYGFIIPMTICLSHQFKNLQSYFYSLNDIFEENIPQEDKESKFLDSFKKGIKMHSHTLWCAKKFQSTCGPTFSAQILVNVSVLVMLMVQMMTMERTPTNVAPIVTTGSALLFGTGFFMCNAGDITVESAQLPTAMSFSGWHRCRAARTRFLLTIAVTQAQKPVVIWALGLVPLSYQSYVSIVKSSYSVFSVIY